MSAEYLPGELRDDEPDPNEIRYVEGAVKNSAEQLAAYRNIDLATLPLLFLLFGGISVFLFALTVGDWDFWMDWRDRRWWPLVTPFSLILLPAVLGTFMWLRFRLPIGATFATLSFLAASWASRYSNFHEFAGFPLNFVSPSTWVGLGVVIDATLLISRSFYFTGFVGAFLFGLLTYTINWPIFAPFRIPIEYNGTMVTVADLMGYMYIRTAIPEYVRIIEESTLRTFGEAVTPLTAVFAGFVTILNYYLWCWVGHKVSVGRFMNRII